MMADRTSGTTEEEERAGKRNADQAQTTRKPLVAIVGRPNVGKSTLFNKLVGRRKAITEETAGVTRDRMYGLAEWNGKKFDVCDTGGLELDGSKTGGTAKNKTIAKAMLDHAFRALDEADVVLALFDATEGLTAVDLDILNRLRGVKKTTFYAANKVDSASREDLQYAFYEAGVDKIWPVSAEHGRGLNDLLDEIVAVLPKADGETRDELAREDPERERIKVAVIGKPNVGKSSLVNSILGFERSIVSEMAGTTRDAVDTALTFDGREYLLIDTAGIRRKARVSEKLEKFSIMKALEAIKRSDVVVLVIDAIDGIAEQEAKIAHEIEVAGKAAVIVLNKWDLSFGEKITEHQSIQNVRETIKFMPWANIVFSSATTGKGIEEILPQAAAAFDQYKRRVPTPKLNKWLEATVDAHPPPVTGKGPLKLHFVTMGGTRPPAVVLFVNRPQDIHFSYARYLENSLRDEFGWQGTPIRLVLKKKKGKPKKMRKRDHQDH
jgi:GTPase